MLGRVLLTTPSGQYKQNNQGCGQSAIGQAKQAKTLLSGKGFAQNLQIDHRVRPRAPEWEWRDLVGELLTIGLFSYWGRTLAVSCLFDLDL